MSHIYLFLGLMVSGTFLLGVYDVVKGKLLKSGLESGFLLGITWLVSGILLFSFILSGASGVPILKAGFWQTFAVTFSLGVISQFLRFWSFAKGDISLISPLALITPPLVLLTGYWVLGEIPSIAGVAGVLITFLGLWFLLSEEAYSRRISFRRVMLEPAILVGLVAVVLYAVSFPFDKKAVLLSSALFYSAVIFLSVGLANLLFSLVRSPANWKNFARLWQFKRDAAVTILTNTLGGLLTFQALNFSSAAYAANLKRLWPFWAVVLSGKFLNERNIKKKILAVLIMFGGITLTILFG